MQFTRLRLNGFKSFVDPTELVIHDGLTGVVGPNGCGKSNLLEALRWVMGETRPKAMRGGGMEDVIFAGAATRPARNFAEVALHIDNTERLAPQGFNDADQIEIVRRITRDAGSAYKAAGRDVRAREVQMLFADASTGAHSPALVRQGRIAELIAARPRDRRRILEEAAGISGLYQRRHEAELKLKGAEANLTRLDDVIEQLAGQLAQLARQARAAARYREIGARLRGAEGLLLYRRWREADLARGSAEAVLRARLTDAAAAERAALAASRAREAAEAAMPGLREEEAIAAAVVQRLQVQKGALDEQESRAARGVEALEARRDQLGRDAVREETLSRDAGETIDRLEAEAAELAAAGRGFEAALAEAVAGAEEAGRIMGEREGALAQLTEDVARLAARHQSVRRLVEDLRATGDRAGQAASRVHATASSAGASLEAAQTAQNEAGADETRAHEAAAAADAALGQADAARNAAAEVEAEARAARSEAEGALGALRAESRALARLVARETGSGGQIMDLLRVEAGFEGALGAALADDLRAPLAGEGSGWRSLDSYDHPPSLPEGAEPLAAHVEGSGVLARRLSQVGIVARGAGAAMQPALGPGQRLVSREGDLWRWDGFCARAEDAPSAATLRMQQKNRLTALERDLARSERLAAETSARHGAAEAALAEADAADREARAARREADAALARAGRAQSRAEADRTIAAGKLESARLAARRHEDEAGAARERLAGAERAAEGLDDLAGLRAQVADVKLTVEAARMTMLTRRSAHDELQREGAARARRVAALETELESWRERRGNAGSRLGELAALGAETEAELTDARAIPGRLAAERAGLLDGMEAAETRRRTAADALATAETSEREAAAGERQAERAAGEAREARAHASAGAEAARGASEEAAARIAEARGTDPAGLLEDLGADPVSIPVATAIETEVAQLKRQRDALGPVNLRAEEDRGEVAAEHDGLVAEKADLEAAIATLRRGIAGLNREGRERLLTAFEQVNGNFGGLFAHLFGGGEARLELVDSDDPLEAGLEILCQPPGKKLSNLGLLSGGEQTLTAMALIFAVFLANPAPICVLDEVDAPLDDANVTRFCDMLDEMTRRTDTRFLIITHHALTMARMDRLFGVTMGEQGVSQLVSVDLRRAEQMVA